MDDAATQKARSTFIKLTLVVVVLLTVFCAVMFVIVTRFGDTILSRNNGSDTAPTPTGDVLPTQADRGRVWLPYVDKAYMYKFNYLATWDIDYDSPQGDSITLTAEDDSVLGIRYQKNNYRDIRQFLLALDISRTTDNAGKPSVVVEWSQEFDVFDEVVIQRREYNLVTEETLIKSYLSKEEYIIIFTIYGTDPDTIESSTMFGEVFNVIGSFQFRTDRFEARGRIVTGESAGKFQCPNGYYLEVEGDFVQPGNRAILLRSINARRDQPYPLYLNSSFLGATVTIDAVYDTEKLLCIELTCDCEDYILVEDVRFR